MVRVVCVECVKNTFITTTQDGALPPRCAPFIASSSFMFLLFNSCLRFCLVLKISYEWSRQLLGPCDSGCWASAAGSPVGANGAGRFCGTVGRVPGGAYNFAPSMWSGEACLLNRALGLPYPVHCSYPVGQNYTHRRTSFLGCHNTFWHRALPRRVLQPRARALARQSPSICCRCEGENAGR